MYGSSLVWILVFDSFSRHFGAINKLQIGEQNLGWNVFYCHLFTLMENL